MAVNSAIKLASTILALLMLANALFIFTSNSVAAEQERDYIYTVEGDPAVATITKYTGPGGAVTIPSMLGGYETAMIGEDAFSWSSTVTSVVIPESVEVIGYAAFYHCDYLTSVTIGGGVWNITYGAFYACTRLVSVTFLGLVAPSEVGLDWIAYTDPGIIGHAYAVSDFPPPGQIFHNLTMGSVIPVPSVPGAPTALTAIGGTGFIRLNWTGPMDPGYPSFTMYEIFRGTRQGLYSGPIAGLSPGTLTFNDTKVRPGISYAYIVRAVNSIGSSAPSIQATGTATPLLGAPGAPQNISAIAGDRQVHLTWNAPLTEGSSPITGYRIYMGVVSGSEDLLIAIGNTLGYIVSGLTNDQVYFFQVSAVNNNGESTPSNEAAAAPASVPSAPLGLQATIENLAIELNWTVPMYVGSGVLVYHIFRDGVLIWNGSALQFTDTNITFFITYSYQIAAENSIGWGPNSTTIVVRPLPSEMRPTAPQSLVAIEGIENISLTWAAPLLSNASGVSDYLISYGITSGSLSNHIITNQLSFVLVGLQKGQGYFVNVAARNDAGRGQNSSIATAMPFGVPNSPFGLKANSGIGQIELNWSIPSYSGPGTLTYHLFRNGTLAWSGSSLTFIDKTGFAIRTYTVAAQNEVGWGPNSSTIEARPIPIILPGAPTAFHLSKGIAFANLTWAPPMNIGSAPLECYKIFRGTNASSLTLLIIVMNKTSYNDTAVLNGQTYYYQVQASSSFGDGEFSGILSVTPQEPIAPPSSIDGMMVALLIGATVVGGTLFAWLIMRKRG